MERHLTIVAVLHIALSIFGLLAAAIVFLAIAGGGVLSGDPEALWITGTVATAISLFILILSVPGLIGGIGLLQRRRWARVLLLIVGALSLLNIPFGTAVGVYTIWALTHHETVAYLNSSGYAAEGSQRIVVS